MAIKKYQAFKEFYPFYLSQHQNSTCRGLHYLGSFLVLVVFFYVLVTQQLLLLWLIPLFGYGFAWLGHYVFEKNKPATFLYPWYSFLGDWLMMYHFIIQIKPKK